MEKFCKKCGNKMNENEQFCSKCGSRDGEDVSNELNNNDTATLVEDSEKGENKPTNKNKSKIIKKIMIALVSLLVIVGGCVGGYFVYDNFQKEKEEIALLKKEKSEREAKEKEKQEASSKVKDSIKSLALIGMAKDSEEYSTLLINSIGGNVDELKKALGYENEPMFCDGMECYLKGIDISLDGNNVAMISFTEGGPVGGESGYDLDGYDVITRNGVSTEVCTNELGNKVYIEYLCDEFIKIKTTKIYMYLV